MFMSAKKTLDRARIEAKLEEDRAALEQSIASLSGRLSPQTLAMEALNALKGEGLTALRYLGSAARSNPLPFALMGASLVWMLFGRKGHQAKLPPLREALSRWEDEGGSVPAAAIKDDSWIAVIDRLRLIAMRELNNIDAAVLTRDLSPKKAASARERVLSDLSEDVRDTLRQGLSTLTKSAREEIAASREAFYLTRISQP
jgi:hypothetical protein